VKSLTDSGHGAGEVHRQIADRRIICQHSTTHVDIEPHIKARTERRNWNKLNNFITFRFISDHFSFVALQFAHTFSTNEHTTATTKTLTKF